MSHGISFGSTKFVRECNEGKTEIIMFQYAIELHSERPFRLPFLSWCMSGP